MLNSEDHQLAEVSSHLDAPAQQTFLAARWVLPISAPALENGVVELAYDRIARVWSKGEFEARFPDGINTLEYKDFGESVICPGLINLHAHLEYTALRGIAPDAALFDWVPALRDRVKSWQLGDFHQSALSGARMVARTGTSFVVDSAFTGQSAVALAETGLRGLVGLELFGLNEERAEQIFAEWLNKREAFIIGAPEPLKQALGSGRIKLTVAPHAPYTVSPRLMRLAADWAGKNQLPFLVHLAESQAELDWLASGSPVLDAFLRTLPFGEQSLVSSRSWRAKGLSAVQHLEGYGLLRDNLLAAHAVHLSDSDLKLLAGRRVKIAHCPRSNARLRCGHARVADILQAGIALGFGTDSLASNDDLDLLGEARFSWRMQRAIKADFTALAQEALYLMTAGAAACLGMDESIGSLDEGKLADIAVFNLSPPLPESGSDAYNLLLYGGAHMCDLYVGGVKVVNKGV